MIGDIIVLLTYNVLYDKNTKILYLDNNQVSDEIVAIKFVMDYQISVSKSGTVYVTSIPLTFIAINDV